MASVGDVLNVAQRIHAVAQDGRQAAEALLTDPNAMSQGQPSNVPMETLNPPTPLPEENSGALSMIQNLLSKVWHLVQRVLSRSQSKMALVTDAVPVVSRAQLRALELEYMKRLEKQSDASQLSRFRVVISKVEFHTSKEGSGAYYIEFDVGSNLQEICVEKRFSLRHKHNHVTLGDPGLVLTTKEFTCDGKSLIPVDTSRFKEYEVRLNPKSLGDLSLVVKVWKRVGRLTYAVQGTSTLPLLSLADGDVFQTFTILPDNSGEPLTDEIADAYKIYCNIEFEEIFDFRFSFLTTKCKLSDDIEAFGEFRLTASMKESLGLFPLKQGQWRSLRDSNKATMERSLEEGNFVTFERPGDLVWRGVNSQLLDQTVVIKLSREHTPSVGVWEVIGTCEVEGWTLLQKGKVDLSRSLTRRGDVIGDFQGTVVLVSCSEFRQMGMLQEEESSSDIQLCMKILSISGLTALDTSTPTCFMEVAIADAKTYTPITWTRADMRRPFRVGIPGTDFVHAHKRGPRRRAKHLLRQALVRGRHVAGGEEEEALLSQEDVPVDVNAQRWSKSADDKVVLFDMWLILDYNEATCPSVLKYHCPKRHMGWAEMSLPELMRRLAEPHANYLDSITLALQFRELGTAETPAQVKLELVVSLDPVTVLPAPDVFEKTSELKSESTAEPGLNVHDNTYCVTRDERGRVTTLCALMEVTVPPTIDDLDTALRCVQRLPDHQGYTQSPSFMVSCHGRGSGLDICLAYAAFGRTQGRMLYLACGSATEGDTEPYWACLELVSPNEWLVINPHGFLHERVVGIPKPVNKQVFQNPAGQIIDTREPRSLRKVFFIMSPDHLYRNAQTQPLSRLRFNLEDKNDWISLTATELLSQSTQVSCPSMAWMIDPLSIDSTVLTRFEKSWSQAVASILSVGTDAVHISVLTDSLSWCLDKAHNGDLESYRAWLKKLEAKTPVKDRLCSFLMEAPTTSAAFWAVCLLNMLNRHQPAAYAYSMRVYRGSFASASLYARCLLVCLTRASVMEAKHHEWRNLM